MARGGGERRTVQIHTRRAQGGRYGQESTQIHARRWVFVAAGAMALLASLVALLLFRGARSAEPQVAADSRVAGLTAK